ncbi:MAG: hypothetical protein IJ188_02925 [Clostridia bacterium]|nr:hypothetical protein [Clostridia bacterium]
MVNQDAVKEVLTEWLDNPYWAAYYNDAPTEECKHYVALQMYASDTEDEEAFEELDQLLKHMGLPELNHLLQYAGNTPERARIAKIIDHLNNV